MARLSCFTLPYRHVSIDRALEGIRKAGFRHVGFGLQHDGVLIPGDDPSPALLKSLLRRFDSHGLQPDVMFLREVSGLEAVPAVCRRLEVARELGVKYLVATGPWGYRRWPDEPFSAQEYLPRHRDFVASMRQVARHAEEIGVTIVLKPHTGSTATAPILLGTLEEIGSPAVMACADPGNVRFYEGISAEEDLEGLGGCIACFVAKDHRGARANADFPVPGEGEVDFERAFRFCASMGFAGPVIVERVDGTVRESIDPVEIDRRLAHAYQNLQAIARRAGLLLEETKEVL